MRERLGVLLTLGAVAFVACRAEKSVQPIVPSQENNNSTTVCETDPNIGQYEFEIRYSNDVDVKVSDPTTGDLLANCELTPKPTATLTPSSV